MKLNSFVLILALAFYYVNSGFPVINNFNSILLWIHFISTKYASLFYYVPNLIAILF